ncbi:MAG: HAMP domain-containing histidine kinase [Eubacterium sp.]|nr:HAMP domain-containing histidine kinase [Eubacterium sp.]
MRKEKSNFKLAQFKWIILVDIIVISGAVMSFGAIAAYKLDLQADDALIMLYMIPPMSIAAALGTYVIMRFVRGKMDVLLNGIQAVGKGDLDVCLDTKNANEYKVIYDNFNSMVSELKATKEQMREFTNEFSHEFKTPITSINGFAQYLINTGGEIETPERMEYLKVIADESLRLSELSQKTLMLSKVEACCIVTGKEKFNIIEQIKYCSILLLPQIEKKKIDLELYVPDCINYYGNMELLEQVWLNLLGNAIKFTPPNGEIEIRVSDEKDFITVSFSDNGIGMDGETVKHIFEKYYQGDGRNKGGNGIGLSIVSRIVSLCGGTVEVESIQNLGSTFKVILPIENAN